MTNANPQEPPIEPTDPVEPPAEPTVEPPAEPTPPTEPHGTDGNDPIDWKKHSREWEERSKANLARAEQAEASNAAIQADLDAARAELAALQASNTRAEAVRTAAKAANVNEDVLSRMSGDSAEEIAENARILAAATVQQSGPSYPSVPDNGAGSGSYGMTLEQINAIKDPTERVMMRAKYPNAQ